MSKRVLLQHTRAPHKGLVQIVGHSDEFGGQPLPGSLGPFQSLGRQIEFASLVKVEPRFALYREAWPKPTGRFGQTMETWHPDQR